MGWWLAFAKEERKKISERTKIRLRRAKREGKQLGRPSTIPRNTVERIVAMRMRECLSPNVIASQLALPASMVRNVLVQEGIQ